MSLILNGAYETSKRTDPSNLYLTKKCYYGDTLKGMPWIKTNIDLSFPELPKMVSLDSEQQPQTEKYYPLAYQRRTDYLRMKRNNLKVQNMTFNMPQQVQQYLSNMLSVKKLKEKHVTSQISLAGEYETKPYNIPLRSKSVMRVAPEPLLPIEQKSIVSLMPI